MLRTEGTLSDPPRWARGTARYHAPRPPDYETVVACFGGRRYVTPQSHGFALLPPDWHMRGRTIRNALIWPGFPTETQIMEMISDPRFSDIRFPQIPRYRFSEMSFETLSFQKPVLMIQIIALNTVSDFFGNRFQFSRMVFSLQLQLSERTL